MTLYQSEHRVEFGRGLFRKTAHEMTSQWERWRLKSQAFPLFTHQLVQAQIQENINASRHWPFCAGNSPVTGEFPAQKTSNAENVSIGWRHQVCCGFHSAWANICHEKTPRVLPQLTHRYIINVLPVLTYWIAIHSSVTLTCEVRAVVAPIRIQNSSHFPH